MIKTRAETVFSAPVAGRCKRFDFLVRDAAVSSQAFAQSLMESSRRMALDPLHTALVDRQVNNMPLMAGDGAGFGQGSFDCVRESWSNSFANLADPVVEEMLPVDRARSFSVFASEFVMIEPSGRGHRAQT